MRRIIAYMYCYKGEEDGLIKCGNVGFCKVFEKDKKSFVDICFKETYEFTGKCKIYSLVKKEGVDKKRYEAVIDKYICEREIVCGKLRAKVEVIDGAGLILLCGGNKYIVLWERAEEIIFLEKRIEKKEDKENAKEITTQKKANQNICDYYLNRAYNNLPKIPVVIEGNKCQAVRLSINDMVFLPRKYWRLANNFFLMEGYFYYQHILFFKHDGNYVLGVPGNGLDNEKERANQFGFTKFIKGYIQGRMQTEKVYWIKYLE